jgi:NAD(P)-dependent dehydrogenase (short-subunit alcohol dehydrogenase family)
MDGFKNSSIEKLALDVTNDEDVERVVKFIIHAEGRIDIVVNNAGVGGISKYVRVTHNTCGIASCNVV